MKNEFNDDYKSLHAAALTLSTKMLASQTPDELSYLDRATRQGSKLYLQLGPLPDCNRIELIMIEPEGCRSVVATIGATYGR